MENLKVEKIDGFIFIDYDETLVNTVWCQHESRAKGTIDYYAHRKLDYVTYKLYDDNSCYITYLRPSTNKLLKFCEDLVGEDNVFILTLGSEDYAKTSIKLLGLNIPEGRIISREYLSWDLPKIKNSNRILIDNENYEYHTDGSINKVNFLYKLPKEKYVKVDPFLIDNNPDPIHYLDKLKIRIFETLKTSA